MTFMLPTACLLPTAEAVETVGMQVAAQCPDRFVIYLEGELGAGKTTFVRGFLRGLGYLGAVKSPTYTLVEPYFFQQLTVYHFDLYRLSHPEEVEYVGIRDYLEGSAVCLIEWAERGGDFLPVPDLRIQLSYHSDGRWLNVVSSI